MGQTGKQLRLERQLSKLLGTTTSIKINRLYYTKIEAILSLDTEYHFRNYKLFDC